MVPVVEIRIFLPHFANQAFELLDAAPQCLEHLRRVRRETHFGQPVFKNPPRQRNGKQGGLQIVRDKGQVLFASLFDFQRTQA